MEFIVRLIFKKMIVAGMLVLWSISVSAAVIENLSERDWLNGDSALTYDESTGLEWLDLDLTSGMSLNQIDSSGILNIFRWATPWEVESLLDAALVGFGDRSSNNLDDNNDAMKWINYLGMTGGEQELRWSQGYTFWKDQYNETVLQMYGVTAIDCEDAINYYGGCVGGRVNIVEGEPLYRNNLSGLNTNLAFDEVIATSSWGMTGPAGALLVRKALSVSEPSILVMFGLGLAGLSFSRRKRT